MIRLAAAFAALFLTAGLAHADFDDCTAADYLARFPGAPTAAGLLCVEHFRFAYATPEGERQMRAISDVAAGWAAPPTLVAGVERGAREAAAAMGALGSYAIDDVTLLLLDDVHGFGESPEVLAITDGRRDPAGSRPGECLVTLYALSAGSTPDEIAVTTAHEIFHCLQFASLSAGQMGTYGAGGTWWIEGAAEYFSAFAVAGSGPFTDRGAAFDAAVSGGTALNEMGHNASPFFFWLAQSSGPSALMPFQRGMAGSSGAGAQRAAMRGALSDDEWLRFAQAYVDADIAHPQGGSLALSPSIAETRNIRRPGTQRLTLQPFAILVGQANYDCGTWGNTLTPDNANIAARTAAGRDWAPWPEEIDTREGRPGEYRLAAMHTGDSAQTLRIRVERRRACTPCGTTDRVDACLNGTWQVTGGGPVEWMRSQGLPLTNVREGPRVVTFRSDGAYGTEPLEIGIEIRDDDTIARGEGFATAAFGRWSAEDGQMTICQDAGGVSGTVTVTTPRTTISGPVAVPGAGVITMRYSCSETAMSTSMSFPGLSDMVTQYGKIAEEPEDTGAP